MIFPYLSVGRGGVIRSLPIITLRVHGPIGHADIGALVDSGAEHSVLSVKLIGRLGLATGGAAAVQIIGVGGQTSRGYLLDVECQLLRYRWRAPAIFSEAVDSPMILGQAGFFQFFKVTFNRRQNMMDIRRSR